MRSRTLGIKIGASLNSIVFNLLQNGVHIAFIYDNAFEVFELKHSGTLNEMDSVSGSRQRIELIIIYLNGSQPKWFSELREQILENAWLLLRAQDGVRFA
jgi:hypothetical protein